VTEFARSTAGIRVRVRASYLPHQSEPEKGQHVWAYRVVIENEGNETVQLLRRSWRIIDARGREHRVSGEGVVGEQPVLAPGERFEYTSGTPLGTPSGFMTGVYHMVRTASGERFDVEIPTFSLDSPHEGGAVH
jgi:ApaG protein